jgi:hypothetical protein
MQITVENKRRYSITFVLDSWSDFPHSSSRFAMFCLLLTVKSDSMYVPMFSFEVLFSDWACPLATVFHRHAWSSVYICGCSIRKVVPIHRTNSLFSFSFNNYALMHGRVTYRQIPLYVWALDQVLAPSCLWWQSPYLGTLIESHRTCLFYADVGLSSLNPILISLVRNFVDLPLSEHFQCSLSV